MTWSLDNLGFDDRERIAKSCFTVQEQKGHELHGLCPAHNDRNRSFSYNVDKDCCHCLACGFSGDLISLWAQANRIADNKEAFKAFADEFGQASFGGKGGLAKGTKGGRGGAPTKQQAPEATLIVPEGEFSALDSLAGSIRAACRDKFGWSDQIIDQIGVRCRKTDNRIAIPIRQDTGEIVNVRLYLPGAAENKIISWGKGYGKAKLFPAPSTWGPDPVILCEGEKDTITALSHGFNAVTQTAGVTSWAADRFNRFFAGRKVFIAYDNDAAGKTGAEKVAKHLAPVAESVAIIQWPSFMADKEDVCDWFTTHGKTAEEFRALLVDAKRVDKQAAAGRSRAERAEEIPEDQKAFFVGKQFKPRLCADAILSDLRIANDPRPGLMYQWDGRQWEEIHETAIRHRVLMLLGQEGDSSRVSNVLNIIRDLTIIRNGRAFNDLPDMLPLKNGMLNIATGDLVKHNPDDLNTYCLDISLRVEQGSYRPSCENFRRFMIDFIPDDDARKEVLKFAAYCLTRETKHEKALFLVGPGGDGKSTFINLLESILGEVNVSAVTLGALDDQFQRVQIKDKLLNVSTEVEGGLLQSNMFKALVSGDPVQASYKNKDGFRFRPVAKHIFAANKFPTIQDTTRGLLRKVIMVEVERRFETVDLDLKKKLLGELDGIFLMLLRHLQILQEEGFRDEDVQYLVECKARFAESNNPVIGFCDLCLERIADMQVDTVAVYRKYVSYCSLRGYKPKSEQHFGRELRSVMPGVERKRESKGQRNYYYTNIALVVNGDE